MMQKNQNMHGLTEILLKQSLQFHYDSGNVTRVYRGEVAPWRTLPCANIAYVLDGDWLLECEEFPQLYFKSGDVAFLPAGVRHRSLMISNSVSKSHWIHFNVFLNGYFDLFSLVDTPPLFHLAAAEQLGSILVELTAPSRHQNSWAFMLHRKALEYELASLLIQLSTPRYEVNSRLDQLQRLLPVLDEINKNLGGNFTRQSLADKVGLSPSRFAQIFKEAMRIGPIDYITRLRMQRAQYLLINTQLTVESIALSIGYEDALYFSRLFKIHYGLSPRNFRNSNQPLVDSLSDLEQDNLTTS